MHTDILGKKPINKVTIKDLAEFYRIGLACGYFQVDEVICFADRLIDHFENPPHDIIDLSMSKNESIKEICSLLRNFEGKFHLYYPGEIMLGLLSKDIKMNKKRAFEVAEKFIYCIAFSAEFNDEVMGTCLYFDEVISMIQNGYVSITRDEAADEFLTFLKKYEKFLDDLLKRDILVRIALKY